MVHMHNIAGLSSPVVVSVMRGNTSDELRIDWLEPPTTTFDSIISPVNYTIRSLEYHCLNITIWLCLY